MKVTKNMRDYLTKQAQNKFEEWATPYRDRVQEIYDEQNEALTEATKKAVNTFIDTLYALGCDDTAEYFEKEKDRIGMHYPYYTTSRNIPEIDTLNKKIDTAHKKMNDDLDRIFFEAEAGGDKDSLLEAINNIKFN